MRTYICRRSHGEAKEDGITNRHDCVLSCVFWNENNPSPGRQCVREQSSWCCGNSVNSFLSRDSHRPSRNPQRSKQRALGPRGLSQTLTADLSPTHSHGNRIRWRFIIVNTCYSNRNAFSLVCQLLATQRPLGMAFAESAGERTEGADLRLDGLKEQPSGKD